MTGLVIFRKIEENPSISNMNIFSLYNITLNGPDGPLVEDVTLGMEDGEKTGLIGGNGSGKSTFLRFILGSKLPDHGEFSKNNSITLGSLPQLPDYKPDMTLEDFYRQGSGPLIELDREYENCLHSLTSGKEGDFGEKNLARLTGRMEREGGFTALHNYLSYCRELELKDTTAPLKTFSGGMIRRASIARTLASGASFITLDEPTNHLDLDTIEWLEDILKKRTSGFLMVTHDRSFLDSVCTSIIEIDQGRMYKYEGNYSVYLEKREERRAFAQRAEERRVAVLRRELEWLKRGPRARTGKDRGRKDRIEELLDSGITRETGMKDFSSAKNRLGKKILEIEKVSKNFGEKEILKSFSYSFKKGDRIGILGPNGSGKSTFLDIISGKLKPDDGLVTPGVNTRFAYLEQTRKDINMELSVLDYISSQGERIETGDGTTVTAEQFLENFLFTRAMFSQPLNTLSGGELRRLNVIRCLASSPNFLLMDEPTNDLDIDTIRLLEDYLLSFPGCILLVSHDRTLLERVTDHLFVFDGNGNVNGFTGNYSEYRVSADEKSGGQEQKVVEKSIKNNTKNRTDKVKKGLTFKEKKEFESILDRIEELEAEKAELENLFSDNFQDPDALKSKTERYNQVLKDIEEKTERWEYLAEKEQS